MYFKDPTKDLKLLPERMGHLKSLFPVLTMADLGSAGGTPPPYSLVPDLVTVLNFEPDSRVDSGYNIGEVREMAIGPKDLTTLHLNKRPFTSSLLPPCRRVVDRYDFSQFKDVEGRIFETVGTKQVRTLGFDEALMEAGWDAPDFIKIDVQGLTLEVLQSARESLTSTILGVQVEVEFLETYTGQRTFGDVHNLMLRLGFEIYTVTNLCKWFFKTKLPLKYKKSGQHTFCDFLYFRTLDSIGTARLSGETACKLLALLLLNDLNDAAAAFFERFEEQDLFDETTKSHWQRLIVEWPGLVEYLFTRQDRAGIGAADD